MKKLELKIDELAVESFDTAEQGDDARGTVRGNWSYAGGTCIQTYCGAECPSGLHPGCERSNAWTDGVVACLCADYTEPCIYTDEPCTDAPCID